ncbi:MAG TPA: discoidin domain-containing protein [Anaerolineales bacterium]|nr:discoidin domain-containing protein [Anaerolineales bacterium]
MLSLRKNPLSIVVSILFLASLACKLPETSIAISTPQPVQLTSTLTATSLLVPTNTPTIIATQPIGSNATTRPTTLATVPQHLIAIHRIYGLSEFYDRSSNIRFIPRGVNYSLLVPVQDHYEDHLFAIDLYDHNRTQADFVALSDAGYNIVRIIFDGCISGDTCIGRQDGPGLNPAYLDNIVDLLSLAKTNHLFVLFASQDLPQSGGYANLASQGANALIDSGRNATLLTPEGVQASQQYWSDILNGLSSRQAAFDVILGWELMAEQHFPADQLPFSLQTGRVTLANGKDYDMARPSQRQALAVDGLRIYISRLKQTILTYDPTALVTMGFLAPDSPNAWREGDNRFVVTAPILDDSALDFLDLHANPGAGLSLSELTQNFGISEHITKPIIMGVVGAPTWTYPQVSNAAIAVQDWIASSCSQSFAGWLYSTYYPSPAGLLDATWGFVDEHSLLMTALSPKNQPDACSVTVLPGRNLAINKPLQVSAALPDQTPDMAVDGDPNTQWSSGEFPTQYIEIDLGNSYSIGEIRLTIGQWPDGKTVHQLWAGANRDTLQLLQEFSGYTYDYDVLEFTPATPLKNIRYIRVVTIESPSWVSWREIEVIAPFPATPTPIPTTTLTPTP